LTRESFTGVVVGASAVPNRNPYSRYPHLQTGELVTDHTWQEWFEDAWAVREDRLYRALFGDTGPGIYTLDQELLTTVFHQESIDPSWLTHGVFECPASASRQTWLYLSSSLSNALGIGLTEPG
jgi:hypothetical protein